MARRYKFTDCFDTIQVISKPARENFGEDSFYCAKSNHSALVSVFDGCGGLGARKYDSFQGHTGAYIAARTVSGALHDWYHDNYRISWQNGTALSKSVNEYISNAYQVCEPYGTEKIRILGSMVREFPTTLALAYAECDRDGIVVHLIWAGDSRVYLLDENGLAQLTKDDTDIDDAFENLMSDGAMNNVLSSDGKYVLNVKTLHFSSPCLIFSATDGCFGYVPSPMEFEYILLKSLIYNKTPDRFKHLLRTTLSQYAGDDLALGMMSFFFESYENTCARLEKRLKYMESKYIIPIKENSADDVAQMVWKEYKPGYERFLRG